MNLILFRITFGLGSRLNPFKRIQRLINSNSVKVRLPSVAPIKLCRGCFNSPSVEDSFFCFVYISLILSWRHSRHAFIYSTIVSFIIFLRVVREPDFLCGQCWAHFIASRGEGIKQFDMKAEQKGKISYIIHDESPQSNAHFIDQG